MPHFFFHLTGQIAARDVLGHDCVNEAEAMAHGNFIAHRIGTEKPEMIKDGNLIVVTNESGDEVDRIPLASTMA